MIPAYPLKWPTGWPRADLRKGAAFSVGARSYMAGAERARQLSVADGLERVLIELKRLRIDRDDIVVSTNLALRLDGYPRSDQANPADPGAAVYWQEGKAHRVIAIDVYFRVADNLAAIAATLESMRAIERHGGAQILERAFTGFTALPAPGASKPWRDVLGIAPGMGANAASINTAYRRLASAAHPDKGGDDARMAELNRARDEAMREIAP